MSLNVALHCHTRLRVVSFFPENDCALNLAASGNKRESIMIYGIEPAKAWALFDLFRDSSTELVAQGEGHFVATHPRYGEMVSHLRTKTLLQPAPEDCPREVHEADMAEGGAA